MAQVFVVVWRRAAVYHAGVVRTHLGGCWALALTLASNAASAESSADVPGGTTEVASADVDAPVGPGVPVAPVVEAIAVDAPVDTGVGVTGPVIAGVGVATMGGAAAILVAGETPGVVIGGTMTGVLGITGLMSGTAYWLIDGLTEAEAEDKVRQGGVALTTVGVGVASFGGLMVLSSFVDASDVPAAARLAGGIASAAGGAALISGIIMYSVGGSAPAETTAWQPMIDVGPGSAGLTLHF